MSKIDQKIQRKFFNKQKYQYDQELILNPPLHTQHEMNEITSRLPKPSIKNSIVDFGAGTGRLSYWLVKKGHAVVSVDISQKSLCNLKNLINKHLHKKVVTLRSIPIKKFSYIVGADVLHHVNLQEYSSKLYSALKKGGKLIFSEPNAYNLSWYIFLPIASSWKIEKGLIQCRLGNIHKLLKRAGFEKVTITGLGLFPRSLLNWSKNLSKFNDQLGNFPVIKLFAYRYIIEAKK